MNFGFITTSRADFGYYIPLLNLIKENPEHEYFIFAGGMHTSEKFGMSYELIEKQGFAVAEKLDCLFPEDSQEGVAKSIGKTTTAYAEIWKKYTGKLDVVFALGDRFEMFAAVSSCIPFNLKIGHLHGGETTLGAIDNKFRHAITAMSDYHFTSNEIHAKRVANIIASTENVFDVGATAIDSILRMSLFTEDEFFVEFGFDINSPYVLTTFHPETVALGNKEKIKAIIDAFKKINEKILCTLPNADTQGTDIRNALLEFEKQFPEKIKCYENLSQKGYLTAMKHCEYMLGNTSSGIIEACSFNVPVVNVGDRQKGRLAGDNVLHSGYDIIELLNAVNLAKKMKGHTFENPYGKGNTAEQILEILTKI